VIPELLSFVSPDVSAVVAHNAGFDFGFLRAAGIDFHRPTQDTFELASILLPGMGSYSLSTLCSKLQIPLPEAHRAMDDAEAAARLFAILVHRIHATSAATIQTLLACGQESGWSPLLLFQDHGPPALLSGAQWVANGQGMLAGLPLDLDEPAPDSLVHDQGAPLHTVDPAIVRSLLTPGGALDRLMGDDFEARPGQQEMARRVIETLNKGDHLIVEAGTGTGKSLAYLLPAALWSVANQRRVVIATNTIALQDQLIEKDIPHVHGILATDDLPAPRVALLKGRANYLCTRRLHRWFYNRQLSALELRVLAKVLIWLATTETGDVGELFLPTPAERTIWMQLCSDSATCSPDRCSVAAAQNDPQAILLRDFFHDARRRAEGAHLLIVNHALLMADLVAGGRVLPPYSHLVVDEAHRLEEAATEQLTYRIDWRMTQMMLSRIGQAGDLYIACMRGAISQQDEEAQQVLSSLAAKSERAAQHLAAFAHSLLVFASGQEEIRQDFIYPQRLHLDGGLRSYPAWSELEIDWDHASRVLAGVLKKTGQLVAHFERRRWQEAEPLATYLGELQGLNDRLAELVDKLNDIMFDARSAQTREFVTWLEVGDARQEATLALAPLFVSETLEKELILKKRSAIFTGATLRTGSGFSFIRDRLGLWDVPAATVESTFDYKQSTLLFLPSDVPEPNQSQYQQAVEQAIMIGAAAAGGATLALFTSYAQLRATADAIRGPLDRMGITVLQHGLSSRQRLLREYREAERAVLLGTRSFWEGIDLPGDELRCLLIVRLPFAVPTDPLVAARSAELENPFRDYTLPDAILRFRQGFGRLIRRAGDRGVVVVLDSRLWRKEYGQAFLESLPACTTRHAPLANLGADIGRWLNSATSR
jgi:DNA polymerase-3 subunit epsilon/ATP-dependent DNA helicase DinG